jgi:PAS domain S-box-containing protein
MIEDQKVNILMVDDQPAKLLSYEVMLAELGENLIKATSAKQALEVLLKTDVAVVLMDVSMPELDGFELAAMIRQHPRFQRTAIIFISAVHLTDLDRLKGYERGAVDYISVPVVQELLRAKVRVFAELHRKTRQLEELNRDLEHRVSERTKELASKAELLLKLNYELVSRNQELDAIVSTAPDVIFSTQGHGCYEYVSERFFEYTGSPAMNDNNGVSWLTYVHPDDVERSNENWIQSVNAGSQYESEYRLRSKEGHYRWFRARAVPIRSPEGNIVKWYGTCSDIHDSKLLEQAIRDNTVELEKMVDRRTDELRRLSVRLMSAQDQERRRIARDLHDGLGQELAVAKMILDKLVLQKQSQSQEACAQASGMIDRAIQQVRTMSHLLHPPLLDEVGLLSALSWYSEGLAKRSGIETVLDVPPDFPRLASEVETAVFRIVQEALTNVFRHSEARKVWISLQQRDGLIVASVLDDGKGIDQRIAELRPEKVGVGIGGMKQRALEFGGELRLRNASPGTLLELLIPATSVLRDTSPVLG